MEKSNSFVAGYEHGVQCGIAFATSRLLENIQHLFNFEDIVKSATDHLIKEYEDEKGIANIALHDPKATLANMKSLNSRMDEIIIDLDKLSKNTGNELNNLHVMFLGLEEKLNPAKSTPLKDNYMNFNAAFTLMQRGHKLRNGHHDPSVHIYLENGYFKMDDKYQSSKSYSLDEQDLMANNWSICYEPT